MKKLILDVDSLRVESFDTHPVGKPGLGTVHGHSGTGCPSYFTGCEACSGAGTYGGNTCETTCRQVMCECTGGGAGTCSDVYGSCGCTEDTYESGCENHTEASCPTWPGYPGCY